MNAPTPIPPRRPRRSARMRLAILTLVLVACAPVLAQQTLADPGSTGVTAELPASTATAGPADALALAPGDYLWTPEAAPAGPVVIVVSLPEQRAHVYRNGTRIGVSTISSGKPGHETPTGVFPILQKREQHHSNLYNGAPMPYMQRLTWDGVALHAGRIPGYPASHGCIRLPKAFAKALFAATERGVTVVVADETSHGPAVVRPTERAPVDAYTGLEPGRAPQVAGQPPGNTGREGIATLE